MREPTHPRQPHAGAFDIIVAGGGYAGLAFALGVSDLLDGEVRIAVVDRGEAPAADDPRASAVSLASQRLLTRVGVWPRLAEAAQSVSEIVITDSSLSAGIRPTLLTFEALQGEDGAAAFIVPNPVLTAALQARVAEVGGITQLGPSPVVGLEVEPGRVTVRQEDGARLAASLLVAADGPRSRLRAAAGIGTVGRRYGQTGIVTTIAHSRPHEGRAIQHFLPGGPFALLPLRGDRCCVTWSEDEAVARRVLAMGDEDFLAEIDMRAGGVLGALQLAGPRRSWPLEVQLARRYVAPRLALIGDAAHGVHPLAGQGLNLALRDAAALAEVVADAARVGLDLADATALSRYERWRRFDSTVSAAAFDGLNRLFAVDMPLARSAREAGLGLVDRLPGLKRWLSAEAAGTTGELPRLMRG